MSDLTEKDVNCYGHFQADESGLGRLTIVINDTLIKKARITWDFDEITGRRRGKKG